MEPETVTESVKGRLMEPSVWNVPPTGCLVMLGATNTTGAEIMAAEDVAEPEEFVTETVYDPGLLTVRVEAVASWMATLSLRHWYEMGSGPEATTDNVILPPEGSVPLRGCVVMDGAASTTPFGVKVRVPLVLV